MTAGTFYDLRFFLITFPIFFILCSINGLAALAVQCESKQPRHRRDEKIVKGKVNFFDNYLSFFNWKSRYECSEPLEIAQDRFTDNGQGEMVFVAAF